MKKISWKLVLGICLEFGILLLGFSALMIGCGKQAPSSSGNYTLSGTVPNSQASAAGIGAKATTVTHIVAIGADETKTLATLNSDGSFTAPVTSGKPYVLGFFNKTGTTITLLGYLRQTDVDWDSLPIINPSGSSTNLGTVTVNSTSTTAAGSIDLTSLLSDMNMTTAVANLYGAIDDPLTALTNLDMDGNGEFDFQEGKIYLFQVYVGMNTSGGYVTGEIDSMISGYNETYTPDPGFYEFVMAGQGDSQTTGTNSTMTLPQAVIAADGTIHTTATGTVSADSSGTWSLFFKFGGNPATSPATAPNGTYTMSIGSKSYTVRNFKATNVLALGSNNNIIYPVFHLVTDSNGYITTAQYKWKKLNNGAIENASAAEVAAVIEDSSNTAGTFTHTSPFISFFQDANNLYGSIIKFDRDGSSVDVSSIGSVKRANVHHIQFSYNLSSRVVCKFDMQ